MLSNWQTAERLSIVETALNVHPEKQAGHMFCDNPATFISLGVYAISDLDQKIEAVKKLESEVFESAQDADLRR